MDSEGIISGPKRKVNAEFTGKGITGMIEITFSINDEEAKQDARLLVQIFQQYVNGMESINFTSSSTINIGRSDNEECDNCHYTGAKNKVRTDIGTFLVCPECGYHV